jgi:hypothetical protein
MTLPDERYRAIKHTERFLLDLCNPRITKRIPKEIRDRARSLLRHYPGGYNLDVIATKCPDQLETSTPIDDLSMLMHNYETRKKDGSKN